MKAKELPWNYLHSRRGGIRNECYGCDFSRVLLFIRMTLKACSESSSHVGGNDDTDGVKLIRMPGIAKKCRIGGR